MYMERDFTGVSGHFYISFFEALNDAWLMVSMVQFFRTSLCKNFTDIKVKPMLINALELMKVIMNEYNIQVYFKLMKYCVVYCNYVGPIHRPRPL